ncbi:MAG TPA: hypothetical protein VIL71_06365 [Spirillospora sp.]
MRCPTCGSDTSAALPRCTHCDAPLGTPPGEEATVPDPPSPPDRPSQFGRPAGGDRSGEDETVRDPVDGTPGSGEPLRPSWEPSGPPPRQFGASAEPPPDSTSLYETNYDPAYGSPTDHTVPAAPPGDDAPKPAVEETHTVLSPEPWAQQIWQPPPPPKKSKLPYFLAAAGGVLLIGLALAIVFWPSGSPQSQSAQPAGEAPSVQQESPAPEQTPGAAQTDAGDAEGQAKAVDALLNEMATARSELGSIVAAGCPTPGMRRILSMREEQLAKARNLEVSALDNGARLKDALVRALEASAESNRRYLAAAPGCPPETRVADVNQRASAAKNEFLGLWAPIAEQAGLIARSESDI